MSRLTKLYVSVKGNNYYDSTVSLLDTATKLGRLEDLEEQLGCPLEVVFKALINGIYIKNIYGEMINFKCRITYKNEELGWYFNIINGYVMVKDYKKTWWLKKDKSE